MAGLTIATLETLFTANVKDFDTKTAVVEKTQKALDKSVTVAKVDANTAPAMAGLDKVTAEAQKLDATTVTAKLDADPSKAKAGVGEAQAAVKSVDGAKATVDIGAKVDSAKEAVKGLGEFAGNTLGDVAGKGLSAGVIGALASIPVVGAVVGIGVAIGKSLMDGLQVEVRSDTLMAKTGLDEKTVAVVARASGEAYANNFGDSLSANMDTARVAIQGGLLDPKGTAKDSQAIIESLSGVAGILGEDIPRVSRSTAQLLRTGLAKDAAGAFDLIVKGSQSGLNVSEDLLDTIDEYSTQFRKVGLEGPMAFGLLTQAVKAGARDTDTAADALKEFTIRAVDGSVTTKAGFEGIGLSAKDMAAKIAAGGPTATAALGLTLDKLREIQDPTERAALAVDLFGTKAEDLGAALFAMDTTTAVAALGAVDGAAKSALTTLGDNAAASIETAQRNIEVAADGIKGALATAFSPEIEGFATFVTENREAVMQFLLDMANGGIDAARALVNGAADMTEAVGGFISGPAADLLESIGGIVLGMDAMMPGDQGGKAFNDWAKGAAEGMRGVKADTDKAADALRENLITNGLDPAQAKLNDVAIPMVAQAAMHDAAVALAKDIDGIGYAADGSRLTIDTLNGVVGVGTDASKRLGEQIAGAVTALDAESASAAGAGETQDELNARYEAGRVALVNQLVAMGFTAEQAQALTDKYGAIPGNVATAISLDKDAASAGADSMQAKYDGLGRPISTSVSINGYAYTYSQLMDMQAAINGINNTHIRIATGAGGQGGQVVGSANGNLIENGKYMPFANGGDRQSMIAPGGANILWAEPETGWETYISGKPSQRARNIGLLTETARRFGLTVLPANTTTHADGGTSAVAAPAAYSGPQVQVTVGQVVAGTPQDVGREVAWAMQGRN